MKKTLPFSSTHLDESLSINCFLFTFFVRILINQNRIETQRAPAYLPFLTFNRIVDMHEPCRRRRLSYCPKAAATAFLTSCCYLHALSLPCASQCRPPLPSSSVRTRTTVLWIVSRKRKRIVLSMRFSSPTPPSVAVAQSVSVELVMHPSQCGVQCLEILFKVFF